MNEQFCFKYVDNLLCQLDLQLRELTQKKNEVSQKINVDKAAIAERHSYVDIVQKNLRKLEEEIALKRSTLLRMKSNGESMKTIRELLCQCEQTLKEEVERRKDSYKHDMKVYEERITSYRQTFQSHEDYHCQSPMAQNLLMLMADKQEIESRIKAWDDEIALKQKELDRLSGPTVSSSTTEEQPDNVPGQQPLEEDKIDPDAVKDSDHFLEISSLHLQEEQQGSTNEEMNAGGPKDNKIQDNTASSPLPEESSGQVNEQAWQDERHSEEQDQESVSEHQEQQFAAEDATEQLEMEEGGVFEEEAPSKADEALAAFPPSLSHENKHPSHPPVNTRSSTPTFQFSFSPGSSPQQEASDKRPAFSFSLDSGPNSLGFSGFGFDLGSSQDEDSAFTFPGSFFNEKKTTESKSPSCPEFLFGQKEPGDDFQFSFTAKSPQTLKDNTEGDFPFSLNF